MRTLAAPPHPQTHDSSTSPPELANPAPPTKSSPSSTLARRQPATPSQPTTAEPLRDTSVTPRWAPPHDRAHDLPWLEFQPSGQHQHLPSTSPAPPRHLPGNTSPFGVLAPDYSCARALIDRRDTPAPAHDAPGFRGTRCHLCVTFGGRVWTVGVQNWKTPLASCCPGSWDSRLLGWSCCRCHFH